MEKLTKLYKENENFRLFLKLLFILLMSRLVMLVLMVVYNVYMGTDRSIAFLMNQWDAKRYQFMIDNGYTFPLDTDPQANWAFFPMYVMVCRFVKMLTFGVTAHILESRYVLGWHDGVNGMYFYRCIYSS